MTDDKTKQKAIEAAADIHGNGAEKWIPSSFLLIFTYNNLQYLFVKTGVDSIAANLQEQKLTVIGEMDAVAVVKKLKKVAPVDLLSVGPAKEEKKEEKKEEAPKKEDKKPAEEKKPEEKKPAEKK